ncbi:hypothetical protein UY3_12937 [Chelonia mydas]|uniref:Uncharacterized protein n=1 Tax=Chelonia mydas TaxID=8469 RepID=M7B389_CHEMY|nr:hypothetical protein UY3_12937 [Chelonia mydas]
MSLCFSEPPAREGPVPPPPPPQLGSHRQPLHCTEQQQVPPPPLPTQARLPGTGAKRTGDRHGERRTEQRPLPHPPQDKQIYGGHLPPPTPPCITYAGEKQHEAVTLSETVAWKVKSMALSVSDLSGGILQEHPFYICGEMQHDKTAKEKEQGRPIFLTDPDCPAQHQGDLGTVAAYA